MKKTKNEKTLNEKNVVLKSIITISSGKNKRTRHKLNPICVSVEFKGRGLHRRNSLLN